MADEDKDRHGWWGGWAGGIAAILVGAVFLLRNLGIPLPFLGMHNWWALFIVIGAVPLLVQAVDSYRKAGKVTPAVLHALLSATAVLLVAAFFLLELDWGTWWPVWVIYGGLWSVLGASRNRPATS